MGTARRAAQYSKRMDAPLLLDLGTLVPESIARLHYGPALLASGQRRRAFVEILELRVFKRAFHLPFILALQMAVEKRR